MAASKLIDQIIANKNKSANLKIVFVDVVAYSQRRSLTQSQVVEAFMSVLETARTETAKEYLHYCEDNSVNFKDDVIFIPSGDGAAICFPFDGIHDVHLSFAKNILRKTHHHNSKEICKKFDDHGWCNCHANFNLAVGVSSGKGIIYKDVNNNYNVAGNCINMAARVMNIADGRQIILTDDAYRELIDVVNDASMDEKFRCFGDVSIKRNQRITIYQYVESGLDYLNVHPPKDLATQERAMKALKSLKSISLPMLGDQDQVPDMDKMVVMMEKLGSLFDPAPDQSGPLIEGIAGQD